MLLMEENVTVVMLLGTDDDICLKRRGVPPSYRIIAFVMTFIEAYDLTS